MFKKVTNGCVSLVQKFLPDPYIFAVLLTFIVFIVAIPVTGQSPMAMAIHWGNGFWSLLGFSMQMALVLVLGNALASAPVMKKILSQLATIPKTPGQAIVFVTFIACMACFLNWGFGLVIGAIFAKEIAKKIKNVDYRLLIASAYSGFLVWHGGISGSIPLALATGGDALVVASGGAVTEAIPIGQTIFTGYNLIISGVIILGMPFINMLMHPKAEDVITIDPALIQDSAAPVFSKNTPAEKMESSKIITLLLAILGLAYVGHYFFIQKGTLDLNIVNLIFMFAGIILHGTPIRYVNAIAEGTKGAAGILLQFPFYAGIMGMMTGGNAEGVSLAGEISNLFVNISTTKTFPLFSFFSAGIVNAFVPSGGGQWAVQGPIMLPAAIELGVSPSVAAMSIAWGDAWTNMIQPFWALPALGIAGLGARDIMGYCVIDLIFSGLVICLGFLFLV